MGEVYLRARYYQPAVGRFSTRDSYTGQDGEPLSLHLYAYCYHNPILYNDMMGHSPAMPQPGPAPPAPPKHAYDYVHSSFSQQAAESYLRATRFKWASGLEVALALKHYKGNKKQEKKLMKQQYRGKYITDQSKLEDIKFGTTNMSYAGCELIAIYNAILLKGKKGVSLSDIILTCELSGYTALTGQWGTNPYRIGKLITSCGVNYNVIKTARKLKMKKRRVYIISFWNSTDIMEGIHTIAVKVKGKNKIKSFNDEYLDTPKTVHGKFRNLLQDRPFIIGYQLKGKYK